MMNHKCKLVLIFCLLVSSQTPVKAQDSFCDPNPCENAGRCIESPTLNDGFSCICPQDAAGILCDLPAPVLRCGNQSIEILIDKRIVSEQDLEDDPTLIFFRDSSSCNAVDRGDEYHLRVDAPFTDCGVKIQRNVGGYSFSQEIVWNEVRGTVERPLVLVEFKCNYTDRYNVLAGPLIPTVTTVDFETSYGTFTVQLNLYKNEDFSPESQFSTRPVIAVEQQVCVQQSLINVMPEHLVLTLLRCWASTNKDGSGDTHDLIANKCVSDETTNVLENGEGSDARFCFQMFKWRESMNAVYLHCLVNVCNATAFPEFCTCQEERKKRSVEPMTDEKQRRESKRVSSVLIHVVNRGHLDDWLDFFEDPSESSFQDSTHMLDDIPNSEQESLEKSGTDKTPLIVVGVVLVVAVVVLGVVVGVYINFRRVSNIKNIARLRQASQQPPLGGNVEYRDMPLPVA